MISTFFPAILSEIEAEIESIKFQTSITKA